MPTQLDVEQAEKQLLDASEERDSWSPKELRQAAVNADGVPFEIVSLAFWRLLNRGELVLDDERRHVRRGKPRT
jgi:hypothetical protein